MSFAIPPQITPAPPVVDRAEIIEIVILPVKKQVEIWFTFGYMKNAEFKFGSKRRVNYSAFAETDEYAAIMAIIDPGGALLGVLEAEAVKAISA